MGLIGKRLIFSSAKTRARASLSMIALASALTACLLLSTRASAQDFQIGVDFSTVIPRGEFRDNIDNNGYGVGGQFLVSVGRLPLYVGADLGLVRYGSERRREPVSPTIPDVTLTVQTDNKITLTHLLLRAQPRVGRVRPYAEGLVGFKYLSTVTRVNAESSSEDLASTTNLSDFAFSYGLGGGLQIPLVDLRGGRGLYLDGRIRYLWGSNAEYLREGSIRRENGRTFFDVQSSRTDVFTVQIGVTFRF